MQAFFCCWMSENTLSQGFESERSISCHDPVPGDDASTNSTAAKQKGFASSRIGLGVN
jgi:hypothetical protein